MYRSGYKRSFAPKTPQKTTYKRPRYGANRVSYANKQFYGRRTRLAIGSAKRFLASRSLNDEVFASEEGLGRSNPKGEYMTLPSLGQGVNCRHTNRVKLWTINLNGRYNIAPADQLMADGTAGASELSNIEGYVGVFIVLDRMPNATQLPLFADVFGPTLNNVSSLLDQPIRVDQLSRFKVLMRERKYVNTDLQGTQLTLKRFIKFSGRNKILTTFKDMGDNTSGRYGNVRENALVLYVIWESAVQSIMRYSINSRIVYFH
ncbi:hypothetical protein RHGRI_025077 [Rhododendron griersonianum]|uniref:Uncharacterized protein n=1 Tax=Rhododendron griersonianum TaxID=479676 RepID=A0AAV6JE43_9ERIC|nr:hypothetical protein RHGRI_025077 [Rhododendron griersonianum]